MIINTNSPKIPTKTSDLTNDSGFLNANSLDISELKSQISANTTAVAKVETLVVTVTMTGSGSSVTASVTNNAIETDMVVINAVLSNPAAQLSDITWNTNTAGTLSLTGTINGTTTVTCYLTKSR